MNAAWYIGRIGGLAVALGVGAALFTGNGIAWAGPDSDDSSVSSESGSQDDSDASDSKPVKKTPAGPFWPHQDLDTVRIDRRLNITRRRGQLTDRPEDIGGHARRPPVRHHPGAAITIGHQRVDIDDTAAQEEPVAVELDRPRPIGLDFGEDNQRQRRDQRRRGEGAVDRDFIAEADRRGATNREYTFDAAAGVHREEFSGNAQCDRHAAVGNAKRRAADP